MAPPSAADRRNPSSAVGHSLQAMAYQVLARKSRPQDFNSLIGQGAIVQALRNAISEKRIAQAYLFSGIRGVGKTSAARVLAKALNCEKGPTPEPCNDCQICKEITRGGDLDVLEVDAATYSKVEQVRELTESLRYGPARDRYKVVILDEVHRLSRQAFDALLKIIEEPPDHLVFVFATTEIEAVPATILSRCQEFRFRRVPSQLLAQHLRHLCDQEGLSAGDGALKLIARAGEGSVRDSVALLDQLATFGSGSISDDEASRLLGGFDSALFRNVLFAILAGDAAAVVAAVHQVEEEGRDPRHVFAQFLGYCRDALHLALGGSNEHLSLPEEDQQELSPVAQKAGYENLLRLMNLLLSSEASVRRSEAGVLALEIAWLRAAELPKLTRVEDLLAGRPAPEPAKENAAASPAQTGRRAPSPTPPASVAPSRPQASAPPKKPEKEQQLEAPISTEQPPREQPAQPSPAPPPDTGGATVDPPRSPPTDPVAALLEAVGRRKQPLQVRLKAAHKLDFKDGDLVLHVPAGDTVLSQALERSSNRTVLTDALRELWGREVSWRFVEAPARTQEPVPDPSSTATNTAEVQASHDPRVQRVLDIFGGTVEGIVQHKGEDE